MVTKKYETAQIRIVDPDENVDNITGTSGKKHQIFLRNDTTGVVVNDGREIVKNKHGVWCYIPR